MVADENIQYVWSDEVTATFLKLIQERIKNNKETPHQWLQKQMLDRGFEKKWHILRTLWKSLKQHYMSQKSQVAKRD